MSVAGRFREYIAAEQARKPGRSAFVAALVIVHYRLWHRSRLVAHSRVLLLRMHVALHQLAIRSRPVPLRTRMALAPQSAALNARLGDALMEARSDDGRSFWERALDALPYWERALELDPELLGLYEKCSVVYHFQGRLRDVVEIEKRGVERQERLARERGADRLGFRIAHSSFASVIGHMAQLDVFVKQQLLAGRALDETVMLAPRGEQTSQNPCYFGYWLPFFPRVISYPATIADLAPVTRLLRPVHFQAWRGFDGELSYYYDVSHQVQRRWEQEGRPPLLTLSEADRERGWACLQALGVPRDAWFVGLHVREDRGDRFLDSRNADISTYRRAIEAVVARGGWVIRMGDRSMTPLPPMAGVVDYAFSEAKSDWMDVFLWAEGRLLIGTTSGPAGVPQTFGKPVLQTNWPIGAPYWYSSDSYLPRLHWSEQAQRYLSFREALSSPVSVTLLGSELARHGVRARDNTPEELEEGVLELLDQVEGRAADSAEDDELLRRYERHETTPWGRPTRPGGARIGRGFLRRHADLLDDVA